MTNSHLTQVRILKLIASLIEGLYSVYGCHMTLLCLRVYYIFQNVRNMSAFIGLADLASPLITFGTHIYCQGDTNHYGK